ncbi:IclR family transcriptional regulator [Nocardioides sp. LHG3406-4]|uniref:IclR family transcriptional regulator n=1 Tax=Nocardioides sp. LHG3406-4 TaxID=2804575 RepID=UPI003CF9E1D5
MLPSYEENGRTTGTAARLVTLIELVAARPEGVGVRAAARLTGIDRSAVSRLLLQLEELDCVRRDPEHGRYVVGPRLFSLAAVTHGQDSLTNAARPILRDLVLRHSETCYLAVRQRDHVVFRDKIDCTHPIRYVIELGKPFPLTTAASGTAILCGMPDEEVDQVLDRARFERWTPASLLDAEAFRRVIATDRGRRYSASVGRWVHNGAAISSPFFGASGACLGALTLSCPADRLGPRDPARLGADVRRAAQELSRRLGYLGQWHRSAGTSLAGDSLSETLS